MSSGSEEEFDVGDDALAAVAPRAPSAATAAAASRTATSQLDVEKPECDDNDDERDDMEDFIDSQGCEIVVLIEVRNFSDSFGCLTAGTWRQERKTTLLISHRILPSDQIIMILIPAAFWLLLTMGTKVNLRYARILRHHLL